MAIKVQGTTVIDDGRNIGNIDTADVATMLIGGATDNGTDLLQVNGSILTTGITTSSLKDSSGRILQILDENDNVVWGG